MSEVIYTFTKVSPTVFNTRARAFIRTFQLALRSGFVSSADKVLERCSRHKVHTEAEFPLEVNLFGNLQVDEGLGFADAIHFCQFFSHEIE